MITKRVVILFVGMIVAFMVTAGHSVALTHSTPLLVSGKAIASASKPSTAEPNPSWHDLYPDYYKVRMASANDGWIVGADGAIRRYTGSEWVAYPSPVTATLRSVYPISDTAWAVGDNNTVLKLVDNTWQATAGTPSCTNFHDIWMLSSVDGWAVGGTCEITPTKVIAHYDGITWQPVSIPVSYYNLNAIQMLSPTEGWAVGDAGTFLHYTSGAWQPYNIDISSDFYSLAMLPDGSEGWAGTVGQLYLSGAVGTPPDTTLHYTSGAWGTTAQPSSDIAGPVSPAFRVLTTVYAYGLAALSPTSRWLVGIHQTVSNYDSSGTDSDWYSSAGANSNEWDGLSGSTYGAKSLYSVYMVATNDVWAVGSSGYIAHYDGSEWQNVVGAKVAIDSLAYNPTRHELYQAGNSGLPTEAINVSNLYTHSTVLHCAINRATWKSVSPVIGSNLDAWAVGLRQEGNTYYPTTIALVSHITSQGCSATPLVTTTFTNPIGLNSVVAVSPTLVVAVGDQGTLAVYQGDWITETLGLQNLNGVSYKDGRYWAVGTNGTIYTTNGNPADIASWTLISTNPSDNLTAIFALSSTEAWAVGDHVHYHLVGSTATRIGGDSNLSALYMNSSSDGWAVGVDGIIEHFDGTAWVSTTNTNKTLRAIIVVDGEVYAGVNNFGDTHPDIYHYYSYIAGHLLHYAPACYDYYADVPASHFAHTYVLDLSCRGIVSGISSHQFAPATSATRLQFAKIITLARGWQINTPTTPTFSDVAADNPLYAFVETAYAHDALSGATAAQCQVRSRAFPCFFPNDPISRAQTAIITVRAFGWPIDTTGGRHFSDVPASFYAYDAIETAYRHGLVNGVGGGLFAPNDFVTRAQIAKIVDLALQVP